MGLKQIAESPDYGCFECPAGEATSSLNRVEPVLPDIHVVVYFEAPGLDAEVCRLQAAGIVFTQLPRDERWLWREAGMQDPSNNVLCLYWAGENRKHPPWRLKDGPPPTRRDAAYDTHFAEAMRYLSKPGRWEALHKTTRTSDEPVAARLGKVNAPTLHSSSSVRWTRTSPTRMPKRNGLPGNCRARC
jgi:hypothetical protein